MREQTIFNMILNYVRKLLYAVAAVMVLTLGLSYFLDKEAEYVLHYLIIVTIFLGGASIMGSNSTRGMTIDMIMKEATDRARQSAYSKFRTSIFMGLLSLILIVIRYWFFS